MKSGLMKRILTMGLCVAMLAGDCMSVAAAGNGLGTYAVTVTSEEIELVKDYNIKVGHYLSEDEKVEIAKRQKFYKSSEHVLNSEQMLSLPVQGGTDYELVKVMVKNADGTVIKTITDNLNDEEQLYITSEILEEKDVTADDVELTEEEKEAWLKDTERTVEMFYKPVSSEFRNAVTYFDYSIMSKGIDMVPTEKKYGLLYKQIVSFDYKGKHYEKLTHIDGKFGQINPNENWNVIPQVVPTTGDVFTNVVCYDKDTGEEAFRWDGTAKYNSQNFVYIDYVPTPFTNIKNAGINSYGIGHEDEFLAIGQTTAFHDYTLLIGGLNANINNAANTNNGSNAIVPNLITGLTSDLKKVITGPGVWEPGYFSAEPLNGKTIYSDRFELKFQNDGHKYVLVSSIDTGEDGKGTAETYAGKDNQDFFPLNDVEYEDTVEAVTGAGGGSEALTGDGRNEKGNNVFFGMRYDFSFEIGNYEGPLQYTFVGDDDLWVFVDGYKVLDLGGLHQRYPNAYDVGLKVNNEVDLWEVTDDQGNLLIDPKDTEKTHQVTVLYMERGAWDSTCYMEFIIPSPAPMDTVITDKPTATIEFEKVDAEKKNLKLEGAVFGLYKEGQETTFKTAVSDKNGKVQFTGVKPGTYYVKEISAPDGYELNEQSYKVVVDKGIKEGTVIKLNGDKLGIIENTPKKGMQVWIRKQDSNNSKISLAGAEFTFESTDGTTYPQTTVTTDDGGHIRFNDVPVGTYELTETKAPNGYVCPSEPWIIEVSECLGHGCGPEYCHEQGNSGKGLHFKITSGPSNYLGNALWQEGPGKGQKWTAIYNDLTTDFEFKKIDKETDKALEGVEFKLYAVGAGENGKDVLVKTVTSDKDGMVKFEDIIKGSYRLEETKKDGYEAAGPWYLEVKVNDKNTGLQMSLKNDKGEDVKKVEAGMYVIENTPEKGSLTITKTVDKVNLVYGAPSFTFKIEGPDGLVLYRSITFENATELTKSITINNLPLGTYKVTELETLRYTLVTANGVKGTVTANGEAKVAFTNKLTDTERYSHSDIVINSFRMDENGNIQISQTREVTEDKVVEE